MSNDIWTALAAPLPKDAIQQRQGPGGKMLDYIDWPFIQHRLDEVVPGEWSLTLQPIAAQQGGEDPYACRATLTIRGVTRENIGAGKDWKDAATDASKRAAVRFGIGLELYQKGATARPQTAPASGGTRSSAPAPTPASRASAADPECPKCSGPMWSNVKENDERAARGEKLRPDYACKDKTGCKGVIWRDDKPKRAPAPVASGVPTMDEEESLPF
jgi:hypothetical protein